MISSEENPLATQIEVEVGLFSPPVVPTQLGGMKGCVRGAEAVSGGSIQLFDSTSFLRAHDIVTSILLQARAEQHNAFGITGMKRPFGLSP